MMDEKILLQQIEYCRARMSRLCEVKPLFSEEVVQTSQTLDELLNLYDLIKRKETAAF